MAFRTVTSFFKDVRNGAVLFWLLPVLLSACVPTPLPPPVSLSMPSTLATLQGPEDRVPLYWWGCRFKMAWPPETEPDFTVDLLLAHAVVSPILKETRLPLWRVHRRAAPDLSGHQFSFLFYSDARALADVAEKVSQNKILQQALAARIVERFSCDDVRQTGRPGLESMSDPNWSPRLQKHWPAFIMGVSSLWLGLVDEALAGLPHDGDFSKLLEQAREAETQVTAIWYNEGQHAFFHHLSAIFGYEPLLIRKEVQF